MGYKDGKSIVIYHDNPLHNIELFLVKYHHGELTNIEANTVSDDIFSQIE